MRVWVRVCLAAVVVWTVGLSAAALASPMGYYRQPSLRGDVIVFVAEGDLWTVAAKGGVAQRLTTHEGDESSPAISLDGKMVAFNAQYEGGGEVYTMPIGGGMPTRRTFDGPSVGVAGWAPDGGLLCMTNLYSTLPSAQLVKLKFGAKDVVEREQVPLAQAAEGCYDTEGKTIYFTRLQFQGSHTKRYKGGTAQNIWKYTTGAAEAQPLTPNYTGTSRSPMFWKGRIYFATDRDGSMNIWSMALDGTDLRQHTRHVGWDVATPALDLGRIVYQLGADLWMYDIVRDTDVKLEITLASDLDQEREHWIKRPMDYLASSHVSPNGDRVVLTARGKIFVAPLKQGRLVDLPIAEGVRCRDARFLPDGKTILALTDQSGEYEFWKFPANGIGGAEQMTKGGTVLRWEGVVSPDGSFIAHYDKDQRLYLHDVKAGSDRLVDTSEYGGFSDLKWSPDGRWLAYVSEDANEMRRIRLYSLVSEQMTTATSDRFDSFSPAWTLDGKWLVFLSNRNLRSIVPSPWGDYQPEPALDRKTEIFMLALTAKAVRSPFTPADELGAAGQEGQQSEPPSRPAPPALTRPSTMTTPSTKPTTAPAVVPMTHPATLPTTKITPVRLGTAPATRTASTSTAPATGAATNQATTKVTPGFVKIDLEGLQQRLVKVPVRAGNYSDLEVTDRAMFFMSTDGGHRNLSAIVFSPDGAEIRPIVTDADGYELSADMRKFMVAGGGSIFVIDAMPAPPQDMPHRAVDLSRWALSIVPREEWRQMFVDAWRMERDYFYDRNMHGVDWKGLRMKYEPLVDRVTTRAELSDLIAQMVGELSALHTFVHGGDLRHSEDLSAAPSSLGAVLERDEAAGGYRVVHIYQSDPDDPDRTMPLAKLDVHVREGDVIESVNGTPALSVNDIEVLLRRRAGQQVLLKVNSGHAVAADKATTRPSTATTRPASTTASTQNAVSSRQVVVTPLSIGAMFDARYHEWEYTRRQEVEKKADGQVGYLHLRSMTGGDFTAWLEGFYPVIDRPGLIIDVRHNTGGNTDSWLLSRLMRKAWFFWAPRVGKPTEHNMQYAYRGHVVILCDEFTASDGEAFTEGVKRLKLGKVIGTRTWGGEVWLSQSNVLVDKGIATAAETGVFGPEGQWLIEGHGVDPDIIVDNLPHATFEGRDMQLEKAIEYLQKEIKDHPVPPVVTPKYPDKSFHAPAN